MPTGLAKSEEHVQRDKGENKRLIWKSLLLFFNVDSLSLWDPSQSQQTMNVEADLWGCKNYEIMETEWKRKGIEQTEGIRWKWRERKMEMEWERKSESEHPDGNNAPWPAWHSPITINFIFLPEHSVNKSGNKWTSPSGVSRRKWEERRRRRGGTGELLKDSDTEEMPCTIEQLYNINQAWRVNFLSRARVDLSLAPQVIQLPSRDHAHSFCSYTSFSTPFLNLHMKKTLKISVRFQLLLSLHCGLKKLRLRKQEENKS